MVNQQFRYPSTFVKTLYSEGPQNNLINILHFIEMKETTFIMHILEDPSAEISNHIWTVGYLNVKWKKRDIRGEIRKTKDKF